MDSGVGHGLFFRFDLKHLFAKGFADFGSAKIDIVITFRGTGMIDAFDVETWRHVAFLDFDLVRDIHLDSAFRSPLIALPFHPFLKQERGVDLAGFEAKPNHNAVTQA